MVKTKGFEPVWMTMVAFYDLVDIIYQDSCV